ncbi:DUF2628 domain-containing protein [Candidatus Omnitrophota bacterium]
MANVKFTIQIIGENKTRSEVIDLLVRESGNSKEDMITFLAQNDSLSVVMPRKKAEKLVEEFTHVGIVPNIEEYKEETIDANALEAAREFPKTWNWWVFFFTYLWYLVKGLWVKLSVYIMLTWLVNHLPTPFILHIVFQLGFWMYMCKFANYDLFLKQELNERLWVRVPFRKWKKLYFICLIVFVIVAVVIPSSKGVKTVKYGFEAVLNFEQNLDSGVPVTESIGFDRIPSTWWQLIKPPAGMNVKSEKQSGNFTQTISYEANKNTLMMATLGMNPAMSGQANEPVGVAAIELLKPTMLKKYTKADDPKVVDDVIGRASIKLPMFFGWLKRFFNDELSESEYKEISGRVWGRNTLKREIKIAGRTGVTYAEVYWTIVEGSVLIVYTDVFPEHVNRVRNETLSLIDSLTPAMEQTFSVEDNFVGAIEENATQDASASSSANQDPENIINSLYTVDQLVKAGLKFHKQGDIENAEKCLRKAINVGMTESEFRTIERLREKLGT